MRPRDTRWEEQEQEDRIRERKLESSRDENATAGKIRLLLLVSFGKIRMLCHCWEKIKEGGSIDMESVSQYMFKLLGCVNFLACEILRLLKIQFLFRNG